MRKIFPIIKYKDISRYNYLCRDKTHFAKGIQFRGRSTVWLSVRLLNPPYSALERANTIKHEFLHHLFDFLPKRVSMRFDIFLDDVDFFFYYHSFRPKR